jgi:hypothetical protein
MSLTKYSLVVEAKRSSLAWDKLQYLVERWYNNGRNRSAGRPVTSHTSTW